jgi:photosystem II stability/assembly factor-like uncharacterized protein
MSASDVIFQVRRHPVAYAVPAILLLLGAVLVLVVGGAFGVLAGLVVLLVGTLGVVRAASARLVLTSTRLVMRTSWVEGKTVDLPLARVESVVVEGKGMLFDVGSVVVTGTGGTRVLFRDAASPDEFRIHVIGQITRDTRPAR